MLKFKHIDGEIEMWIDWNIAEEVGGGGRRGWKDGIENILSLGDEHGRRTTTRAAEKRGDHLFLSRYFPRVEF